MRAGLTHIRRKHVYFPSLTSRAATVSAHLKLGIGKAPLVPMDVFPSKRIGLGCSRPKSMLFEVVVSVGITVNWLVYTPEGVLNYFEGRGDECFPKHV